MRGLPTRTHSRKWRVNGVACLFAVVIFTWSNDIGILSLYWRLSTNCKFIQIAQPSTTGFILVWLSCAKSEICIWLVKSSTVGTQIDIAMALALLSLLTVDKNRYSFNIEAAIKQPLPRHRGFWVTRAWRRIVGSRRLWLLPIAVFLGERDSAEHHSSFLYHFACFMTVTCTQYEVGCVVYRSVICHTFYSSHCCYVAPTSWSALLLYSLGSSAPSCNIMVEACFGLFSQAVEHVTLKSITFS